MLFGGPCWGTDGIDFTNREALEEAPSDNGTVTLQWANPDGETLVLEQSSLESFDDPFVRYTGTDTASVMSGLAEGTHYFRIGRAESRQWSAPVAVMVEFFPRDQLALLLGLGSFVVLSTMGTIVIGWAKNRNPRNEG